MQLAVNQAGRENKPSLGEGRSHKQQQLPGKQSRTTGVGKDKLISRATPPQTGHQAYLCDAQKTHVKKTCPHREKGLLKGKTSRLNISKELLEFWKVATSTMTVLDKSN